MPDHDVQQKIFKRSMDELRAIVTLLDDAEKSGKLEPLAILIGGWAVYSYNPWYGSVDIDLVTNKDAQEWLMWHLTKIRGFVKYRAEPPVTVIKYINIDGAPRGGIIIDFIRRSKPYPFEGIGEKPLEFKTLDAHTELRDIEKSVRFRVPDRTQLLIYKLKASWDRRYRLKTGTSCDEGWEISKLEKDHCDILALLDRSKYPDELDYALLAEELDGRDFLRDEIKNLPNQDMPIKRYKNMTKTDVESICESLLLLTKK